VPKSEPPFDPRYLVGSQDTQTREDKAAEEVPPAPRPPDSYATAKPRRIVTRAQIVP